MSSKRSQSFQTAPRPAILPNQGRRLRISGSEAVSAGGSRGQAELKPISELSEKESLHETQILSTDPDGAIDGNNNDHDKAGSSDHPRPPRLRMSIDTVTRWVEETLQPAKLQQATTVHWTFNEFMDMKDIYLDEFMNTTIDGEAVPLRTSLISTGEDIQLPSLFLAHLYMGEIISSDATPVVRDSIVQPSNPDGSANGGGKSIFVDVSLKLVECTLKEVDAHFEVQLKSSDEQFYFKIFHFLATVEVERKLNVFITIPLEKFLKIGATASLDFSVKVFVYRPRIQWGFSVEDLTEMDLLMRAGRVDNQLERSVAINLVKQCSEAGLTGLVDCLKSLVHYYFFPENHVEEF